MPDNTLNNVPGMKNAAPVPVYRVEELSQNRFIESHVFTSQPCVIRGAIRHWPAMENWRDPDYLKRRAGHHSIYYYSTEYHITAPRMDAAQLEIGFAEVIERMHDPKTRLAIVATALPVELRQDLGRLSFLARRCRPSPIRPPAFSFIAMPAPPGTITPSTRP